MNRVRSTYTFICNQLTWLTNLHQLLKSNDSVQESGEEYTSRFSSESDQKGLRFPLLRQTRYLGNRYNGSGVDEFAAVCRPIPWCQYRFFRAAYRGTWGKINCTPNVSDPCSWWVKRLIRQS